jgi:hypothetical protein
MTTRRRLQYGPIVLAVLPACLAQGYLIYGRPFDRDAWHHRDLECGDRLRMVNDLRFRHLRGLTREQVVELLGPSEDPSVFQPHFRNYPKWDLVYMLGSYYPWWQIGPGVTDALVIRFGPDGRVRVVKVGHEWKFRPSSGGVQEYDE